MNEKIRILRQCQVYYTLRIAVAMCFIGHGAFGIITKPIWANYFAVFGIGNAMAYKIMPILGSFDIILGIILLVYPVRVIPLWLVIWGIGTALLRPLSGEPFAEFIERAGNFGAPLALLIFSDGGQKKIENFFARMVQNIFKRIIPNGPMNGRTWVNMIICLRIVVVLLLIGHSLLNLDAKASLLAQYARFGFNNPETIALFVGLFEMAAALSILIRPIRPLLFAFLIWKVVSELFYPHYVVFEWLERCGSYGAMLALWFALAEIPDEITSNNLVPTV